jgi:predicted nucleic acid-binding protein
VTVLVFPDNTVLINFAIINRMDLLSRLANGNGRWCATVATECAESARLAELAALDGAREIFGEPLFPDAAEHQDVRVLRDELAGPGDHPSKHLGEAETLAIIVRRQLVCIFVTDDRDAARLASMKGVQGVDTWVLLRVAHVKGWLDGDTLWGYVQTLQRQGRGAPPGVRDRLSFDKWLNP